MNQPLIIGITGGIGGGKSTLARKLRSQGYLVYDCDREAKKLQDENPFIRQKIQDLFGEGIYDEERLRRKELAKIVFKNPDLLKKLNEIVHPFVKEDFKSWINQHFSEKFLFIESAILFESSFNELVDKIILMTASEEVRIKRVVKRDGISLEEVKDRIMRQLPDSEKIPYADYIIHSDDGKPLLEKMQIILNDLQKQIKEVEKR